ncbi:hypothetical protein FACS1894184_09420 [Clostridia bacterium]|nr:hypothetical protein FACS1894184_09420 [Clostridia bacterium]
MEAKYNVSGEERKRLARAVVGIINEELRYAGMPTKNFTVGAFTINPEGTLSWDDDLNAALVERVIDELAAQGFEFDIHAMVEGIGSQTEERSDSNISYPNEQVTPEQYAEREMRRLELENEHVPDFSNRGQYGGDEFPADVPDSISIELPTTNVKPAMLTALLNSKTSLIKAALGKDRTWEHGCDNDCIPLAGIPIEFDEGEGKVRFEWLRIDADSDVVQAWSTFLAAAVRFAKTAKRVTATDADVENQKFAFRVFLTRLGLVGAEYKTTRRILLRNLTGCSAWKNGPPVCDEKEPAA